MMPGQASVTVVIGPQKSSAFVLKKIMNIPPPNILEDQDDDIEKEKQGSTGDGTSGGSGGSGISASLTPAIWDKTIPYDGETFHLEYMDLDEFLLENEIPVTLEEELNKCPEVERQDSDTQDSSASSDEPAAVSQMPEEENKDDEEPEDDPLAKSVETTAGEMTNKLFFFLYL
ncbi:thyrotroph embryonic factor-like protein [Labeo rohita]|uniref:Thyrotroph embryonic factor-like protein n=1 Tax=Labeo rohita TaxID=84645 RepID=A0A498NZB4_LABRO|nr:thyrotroph embryonic factor-like protein [Labeo rohita]